MGQFIRQTRESGIELLRLIAILMIVASHSLPFYGNPDSAYYVNLNSATMIPSHFVMSFIKYFGQIGNCIFMVISAFFLLDSKNVKKKKVLMLIMDSFCFSVVILFIALLCGVRVLGKEFIKQLLPITYQGCWFVGCYLFLYLVHPILNKIISGCDKLRLLRVSLLLFVLYSILSTVLGGEGYYYNFLVAFIMIYFVTAYFKLYLIGVSSNRKINISMICIGLFGLLALLFVTNVAGLRLSSMSEKMLKWNIFSNPLIVLFAIGMFNLFKGVHFKSAKINSLAALILYVYMIHENPLVRDNFKPLFFQNSPFSASLISSFLLMIFTVVFCFPVSGIYKIIVQKVGWKVWMFIWDDFERAYLKLEEKMLKIK